MTGKAMVETGISARMEQQARSNDIHKAVDKTVESPVDEFQKYTIVFNYDHIAYDTGTHNINYNQVVECFFTDSVTLPNHSMQLSTAGTYEHDTTPSSHGK